MNNVSGGYDVVVVGFGAAGACAAITAAENGARVLVVDRALGGGASALSGGIVYAGGGTPYQHAAGYEDSPDNMFNYLHQEVQGVVDDDVLRRFCAGSVERLAWLERHGAKFDSSLCGYKTSYPTDEHYLYFSGNEKAYPYNRCAEPAPRGHRQVAKGMGSGRALWEALRDAALGLGVTFLPLTRVDELLMTDGRVHGIRCRTMRDDGSKLVSRCRRLTAAGTKLTNWTPPIGHLLNQQAERIWQRQARSLTVQASAVVLAAGGFIFNRDMLRRHAPSHVHVSPLGTEGDDGAGIALGVSVGGATAHLDHVTAWRFMSPPAALAQGIAVGINGTRIANEDLYGATLAEVMIRRFGGQGFLITDSTIWRRARSQFLSQTQLFQRATMAPVFAGAHQKAATIAALADRIGVSQSGLIDSVDSYNTAIAAGAEDPAHKATDLCAPILEPPFYAVDISLRPSPIDFVPGLTLGGLTVDTATGLVRTAAGGTVEGLYAAGRTAVGICSNSYVSGLALADCVFSGRRAGEHASRPIGVEEHSSA
ncbi:FAD-binding protein [Mycolicibacterium sp. CH28]|uniref:FAD-binding protein n=1 Tax=Mycolicibacterium sp. CH28 TaxID=2512237 RepID=UPI0010815081|nr:FAD-binding protein [Mycolicibacterium sp. CH28]TGD87066.1 FAD-binding protein [Mycolicibacterium sp. CH28]